MTAATVDATLALLARSDLTLVDVDGPPPELHPRFRDFVILVRALRRRLVHRANLAVVAEPAHQHLPDFLAEQGVRVVVALPGMPSLDPLMRALLRALRRYNAAGYGGAASDLILDLVIAAADDRDEPPGTPPISVAARLQSHGVRWSRLHLVPPTVHPSADPLLELQRLAGSIEVSPVAGSTLCIDWDGSLWERQGERRIAGGKNVREVHAPTWEAATISAAAP
jgi:hypothetical protein